MLGSLTLNLVLNSGNISMKYSQTISERFSESHPQHSIDTVTY